MKILIIRNIPSYMAVKNNTYNIQEVGLAKALVRKGHVCDIIFWTDGQEEIVTLPVGNYGEIHIFYKRGKTLLKNAVYTGCEDLFAQYDVLQPCEYNQIQAWYLARKYPDKTVIYHGPYYSEFNKRYNLMCRVFDVIFLKSYIKRGTEFIVKSGAAKEFLVSKGISEENIQVVGVGIDTEMFCGEENACEEELYLQMKRDEGRLRLLYIGRFEERRNLFFILDVFNKVHQANENARLYLIGTGKEKYVKSVFEYADKLGIREYIVWQERMEQKYLSKVYNSADFFLLPAKYEIFGMVLLEAMYCRTVVLTTKNGGSGTLIRDGENGFILDDKDTDEWIDCILNVYRNKALMKQIQNDAFKTVAENFTWDKLAVAFAEQYKICMRKAIATISEEEKKQCLIKN